MAAAAGAPTQDLKEPLLPLSPGLKRRGFKRTSKASQDCQKLLRVVFPLLVAPLCLTSFVYTCLYAYIYATEGSYGPDDWQKCLTVPNIGNLHLDNNRFCTSASNFAGQAYLSLLVAVGGLHLGLRDNDLLWFSTFTCMVGLVGITIFRESYPYFLDPHFMSTTLFTLTKYIHAGMYDDLSANTHLPPELKDKIPSSEVCQTAYRVNLAFLAVQWGVLSLAILVSLICAFALYHRPRRGRPRVRIHGRGWLVFFACSAFVGMLTMLVSKEKVADLAIQVAKNDAHDTSYPFSDNNLDLVSFTTLLAIGTALYSVCKPSIFALTLCAGVRTRGCLSLIYSILYSTHLPTSCIITSGGHDQRHALRARHAGDHGGLLGCLLPLLGEGARRRGGGRGLLCALGPRRLYAVRHDDQSGTSLLAFPPPSLSI